VEDGVAVTTRLVAEGAGDIRLPAAGGADHEDVLRLRDPFAGGQALDECAVEAAGMAEVDVLHARLPVAELGELQAAGEPAGLAFGPLAIDEQPDAVSSRSGRGDASARMRRRSRP